LGGDDTNYYAAAGEILSEGQIAGLHHHSGRLVLLILVGFPGVLLDDFYASCITNILWSVAADATAVLVAYRLMGSRAALLCAIVLLLNGLVLSYAGTLLPEPLVTLFTFLATWAFQKAIDADRGEGLRFAIAAGDFAGLAYSVKDTGILVVPLLLLYLAVFQVKRTPIRHLVPIAVSCVMGFVLIVLLECCALWLLTGDFAYRYHAIAATHNSVLEPATGIADFLRRGWWNLAMVLDEPLAMGVPAVAFAVAWGYCLVRRPDVRIFAFVGLGLALYSLFGTSSLTRLVNLPFQERYATLLLPFGAVCLAALAANFLSRPRTGAVATVLIFAASLWAGIVVASPRAGTLYFAETLRNAVVAIDSLPDGQVAAPEFLCKQIHRVGPARMRVRLVCLPRDAIRVPDDIGILVLPTEGRMADLDEFSGNDDLLREGGWTRHSIFKASQENVDRLLEFGESQGRTGAVIYVRRRSDAMSSQG
jgi:4-amino-4-deoxy-L-arabinose transferase-like glycosyltransferase